MSEREVVHFFNWSDFLDEVRQHMSDGDRLDGPVRVQPVVNSRVTEMIRRENRFGLLVQAAWPNLIVAIYLELGFTSFWAKDPDTKDREANATFHKYASETVVTSVEADLAGVSRSFDHLPAIKIGRGRFQAVDPTTMPLATEFRKSVKELIEHD